MARSDDGRWPVPAPLAEGAAKGHGVVANRPGLLAAAVALAGGLAVFAVAHAVFPDHSINHDEAVYLQQAAMLLDGRLFLHPPVADAFRPWFFVDAGDRLYPKYAPVPAATFAVGLALGDPRLSLALVGAAVVAGVYGVVREAFHADDPATLAGRRTALLAAVLAVGSPAFLVETSVFLPYAPTAAWNLLFAFAYLRADRLAGSAVARRRVLAWAAVAGLAVGVAFFARPFSAVLFAAPFVGHATWTMHASVSPAADAASRLPVDRRALRRQLTTATLGLAGVAAALAYNAVVTGDPLVFPYEAFAPRDGPGFGYREVAGHGRVYTPALALEANARVVAALLTRWTVAGLLGTALAAVGVAALLRNVGASVASRERRSGSTAGADPRRLVLAGLFVSVVAGNVLFWGNLNILGVVDEPGDGLVHFLGPYYHYDLLLPLSAFAADGLLRVRTVLRDSLPASLARHGVSRPTAARVGLAAVVVGWTVLAGAAAGTASVPLAENRETSRNLAAAYAPFEERALDDAVVFLPTPYGDWLGHPFQPLRNDPGYDAGAVYALRERQFAVVDAFPDRRYYRYTYRGTWAPFASESVEPHLQRVRHVRSERVRLAATVEIPAGAEHVSVRLAGANRTAYFVAGGGAGGDGEAGGDGGAGSGPPDEVAVSLTMADGAATLTGPSLRPLDGRSVRLPDRGSLHLQVDVDFGHGEAFAYRLAVPVALAGDEVRALTPYVEVCRVPRRCGGGAAYVPGAHREGVGVAVDLTAGGGGEQPGPAVAARRSRRDPRNGLSRTREYC
jgi:hypothetical protein